MGMGSLISALSPLQALSGEMSPFLCSGSHQAQRDCQPSALNCFVEAMSQCVPPIPIRPCVLKYLGKTHNLWLRSTLMLEQQAFEKGLSLHSKPKQSTDFYEQESITPPQQVTCLDLVSNINDIFNLTTGNNLVHNLFFLKQRKI